MATFANRSLSPRCAFHALNDLFTAINGFGRFFFIIITIPRYCHWSAIGWKNNTPPMPILETFANQ